MKVAFDSFIKGGLPIAVEAYVERPEPDIGINDYWVDDLTLFWRSGHALSLKMYKSIPKEDFERLDIEALEEAMHIRRGEYDCP